ncbi:TRAP transporter substrate-binding protein [Aureimonas phyllosphaerae]|uniref:TRAP transporter substrate-binding protein n=1 Tax=Aureimonas phyllosphaerae TaxID=1166078 RepID=UPI003A5C0F5C
MLDRMTRRFLMVALVGTALSPLGLPQAAEAAKLRLAHASSNDSLINKAALEFQRKVKEKTNGELEIVVFPDGQLGDEDPIVEGVGTGSIDIGLGGSVDAIEPRLNVVSLPFLFQNNAAIHGFLDGPVGQEMLGFGQDRGYVLLGALDSGFRQFASEKTAITTPADLSGLKIRTPPNPVILATMRQLGALAEAIPFGQVYTSLQANVVSAVEPEIRDYYDSKWYEVAGKLSIANYIWTANWWFMNKDKMDALPPNQQAALKEAATETVVWYRGQLDSTYARILDELKAKGVEVSTVDPAPFRTAVTPVYDEFGAEWGEDLVRKVRKAASE